MNEFKEEIFFERVIGGLQISITYDNKLFKSTLSFELEEEDADTYLDFIQKRGKLKYDEQLGELRCSRALGYPEWNAVMKRVPLTEQETIASELERAHARIDDLESYLATARINVKLEALVLFEYKNNILSFAHNAPLEIRDKFDTGILLFLKNSLLYSYNRVALDDNAMKKVIGKVARITTFDALQSFVLNYQFKMRSMTPIPNYSHMPLEFDTSTDGRSKPMIIRAIYVHSVPRLFERGGPSGYSDYGSRRDFKIIVKLLIPKAAIDEKEFTANDVQGIGDAHMASCYIDGFGRITETQHPMYALFTY